MRSDPLLEAAFWAGTLSLAMTGVFAILITSRRLWLSWEDTQSRRFEAQWRPALLAAALADLPMTSLPPLQFGDHSRLLRLWMYLHESVRGSAHDRLVGLARRVGLPQVVARQLRSPFAPARLQAVLAAGLLRDASAWDQLVALSRDSNSLLSVSAARALARIDTDRVIPVVLPLILRRTDWNPAQVVAVLGEDQTAWHAPLAAALPTVPAPALPRALQLAGSLRLSLPLADQCAWLSMSNPAPVLQAALALANSPALAPQVRLLLAHPDMPVRAEAARRMTDMATPHDIQPLARLLQDAHWQVRLAAARSLVRLPFLGRDALAALAAQDAGGAEALHHALAEESRA